MTLWVVVCCDNVVGVASSLAKADELYRCGHGQDSYCCFTERCELDKPNSPAWTPPPRHHRPMEQTELPV